MLLLCLLDGLPDVLVVLLDRPQASFFPGLINTWFQGFPSCYFLALALSGHMPPLLYPNVLGPLGVDLYLSRPPVLDGPPRFRRRQSQVESGLTYPRSWDLARNVVSEPTINMMIIALNICVRIPEHINVVKGHRKGNASGIKQVLSGSLMHPDYPVFLNHPIVSSIFLSQRLSPGINIRYYFC